MTVRPSTKAMDAALAAGLGLACALILGVTLAAVAAPADFAARVAKVDADVELTQRLLRAPRGAAVSPEALCRRDPSEQAGRMRAELETFAAQANLTLSGLRITPDDSRAGRLVPVQVRFEARGSYEAVLLILDRLARQQPQVFAETVDLTSQTTSVALVFKGRLYCAG